MPCKIQNFVPMMSDDMHAVPNSKLNIELQMKKISNSAQMRMYTRCETRCEKCINFESP